MEDHILIRYGELSLKNQIVNSSQLEYKII